MKLLTQAEDGAGGDSRFQKIPENNSRLKKSTNKRNKYITIYNIYIEFYLPESAPGLDQQQLTAFKETNTEWAPRKKGAQGIWVEDPALILWSCCRSKRKNVCTLQTSNIWRTETESPQSLDWMGALSLSLSLSGPLKGQRCSHCQSQRPKEMPSWLLSKTGQDILNLIFHS